MNLFIFSEDLRIEDNKALYEASLDQNGLVAFGSHSDDNVGVTLGHGATSTVTVPGFLSLGGHNINDIDITSEFG